MVQDHMLSHYRKLYSAKAVVDSSTPKSLLCSVKYNDQKRREQLKKRPPSAGSLSQSSTPGNNRTSCSSKYSRVSLKGEHGVHHCTGGSVKSTSRFNTTFRPDQIVYSTRMLGKPESRQNHYHSLSEFCYRSPHPHRQHSARSFTSTATKNGSKAFQDPVQKTYSGDLMLKHTNHFTQEKPFTPRTLKSDSKSCLSRYRYYTPPRRKQTDEHSVQRQEEESHESIQVKAGSSVEWELPQTRDLELEWSDDEISAYRPHSKINQMEGMGLRSSSRVSPEGMKSPIMSKVNAEEEELMYLEFISDVTNEILSSGIYSDRVLKRVFKRHIEMNKHLLEEEKMRHLLDVLHNDLQSPSLASSFNEHSVKNESEKNRSIDDVVKFTQEEACLAEGLKSPTLSKTDFVMLDEMIPRLFSTPVQCSISKTGGLHYTEGATEVVPNEQQTRDIAASTTKHDSHLINKEDVLQNSGDNCDLSRELEELGDDMASLCVSPLIPNPQVNQDAIKATVHSVDDF
ncbi:spermatogenesis-associated protein 7 isoform X2 [Denticeps clupeoides]|nr:spermatogenesis-associated protein 7 isoform X2 [Denticeps clupeoides]